MRRPASPPAQASRFLGAALLAAAIVAAGGGGGALLAWREGPPPDRVGACGFGPTCKDGGCHSTFPVGSTTLVWDLAEEAPSPGPMPAFYVPGRVYDLRLTVTDSDPAASVWGFELAPLAACPSPDAGGELVLAEPMRTRTFLGDRDVVFLSHACTCPTEEPTCCGYVPFGSGGNSWAFTWIAPRRGTGEITFPMAFNAANWDGTPDDDRISLGEAFVSEELCPPTILDLTVRLAECAGPGETRVELLFTGSGQPLVVRATDEGGLPLPRETWDDAADTCLALDPRPLVFYSLAEECALGSEGVH